MRETVGRLCALVDKRSRQEREREDEREGGKTGKRRRQIERNRSHSGEIKIKFNANELSSSASASSSALASTSHPLLHLRPACLLPALCLPAGSDCGCRCRHYLDASRLATVALNACGLDMDVNVNV